MKLAMYESASGPRPAIVWDDLVLDVISVVRSAGHLAHLAVDLEDPTRFPGIAFQNLDGLRDVVTNATFDKRSEAVVDTIENVTFLAPVVRPSKILCVGLNYRDHIEEVGLSAPKRPHVFAKLPSALNHPDKDLLVPWDITQQVDYEAELAVVIGAGGRGISAEEALDHVLGYTIANDVSSRDWQFDSDNQLTLGKGFDTFFPLGPWIVTRDEIEDPQSLRVRCFVAGELRQDATTAEMTFGVAEIIHFLSTVCTLEPGDVIATGTPAGVGFGRKPQTFLEPGQEILIDIDRIGVLRNQVL